MPLLCIWNKSLVILDKVNYSITYSYGKCKIYKRGECLYWIIFPEFNQIMSMQPVRQDMVGKNIVANDMDDTVQYSDNAGGYYVLETGTDGTIWLEEYEKMQSLYLKEQVTGTQERLKKGRQTDIERNLTT